MSDGLEENVKNKDELLRLYQIIETDLAKYQKEFRCLTKKGTDGKTAAKELLFRKTKKRLNQEKYEIQSQIQPASGITHKDEYKKQILKLKENISIQEHLQNDINKVQKEIKDLDQQILRVDKQLLKLKAKSTSEHHYRIRIEKAKQQVNNLETRLERSKIKECSFITENDRLRRVIDKSLKERSIFNKMWNKSIRKLSKDKKYLIDLVERAISIFDQGTQIHHSMMAVKNKNDRDIKFRVTEMQDLIRIIETNTRNMEFFTTKAKVIEIAELEPREQARRQTFKVDHENTISQYQKTFDKAVLTSGVENLAEALEKFEKQENLGQAYFKYINELICQVEILNGCLMTLNANINTFEKQIQSKFDYNLTTISSLKLKLEQEKFLTNKKIEAKQLFNKNLESLFKGLMEIGQILRCDSNPLTMALFSENPRITMFNVEKFFSIFEDRLNKVLSFVFFSQTHDQNYKHPYKIVRDIDRPAVVPTNVEAIVPTQQCAECAEGEEVNDYDDQFVKPLSEDQLKKKIRMKIVSPEMQYRLHNVSQCRLPRSIMLTKKR